LLSTGSKRLSLPAAYRQLLLPENPIVCMKRIELDIMALSHSVTQSHNYAIVLGERRGQRRLPIVIGSFEAQAIAVAMERMTPNRPLTHDLFKNTLDTFHIELKEVVINNLLDGIFYARLVCLFNGETFEIDSRTSDAIAMAVRFECPIYTYDFILEAAGVVLEDQEEGSGAQGIQNIAAGGTGAEINMETLERYTVDDLQTKLSEVLDAEDYETAARIRDEIRRREQKS
jgi:hypothetical protein